MVGLLTRHSAHHHLKSSSWNKKMAKSSTFFFLMDDYVSQVLEGENDEHQNRWGTKENLWSSPVCVVESKNETLNVKPLCFSSANATSHIDSSLWLCGWLVWILPVSFLCVLFIKCQSLLFVLVPQDHQEFSLMKESKDVDIHFSRFKWFTLKIQTEINKYEYILNRDQLNSALAF